MKNSKLLGILRFFSARDRRRFSDFVHSPFFNKNLRVRRLCDHLLEYAPAFDHPDLRKEIVYDSVIREGDYNELRLNNIISDLLQLVYAFLAVLQHEERPQLEMNLLLEELLDRELHQQVERNARRYRQLRERSTYRSHRYFLETYHFHEVLDRYSLTKGRRGYDENLQEKNDALDVYYWCNKLRIACDMASRNIVVQAGYQCHFLDDILRHYRNDAQGLQQYPALQVYHKTYQMLTTNAEVHYRELKALLAANMSLFLRQELNILYRYVLNFCVRKINFGDSRYYREILEVYQLLLDEKIIFKNGYLTQWSYINIITAGIRLREYDWTERFINEYRQYLLPQERHNVYTYNLAAFYFEKKDYLRALQQLHDVEFTDTTYHLGAKIIQLKSYFELQETEAFFSLMEAFKKYLIRNREISDYRKKANNNFLRLAQQLYQIKVDGPYLAPATRSKRFREIQQRLNKLSPLANKEWLLEVAGRGEGGTVVDGH